MEYRVSSKWLLERLNSIQGIIHSTSCILGNQAVQLLCPLPCPLCLLFIPIVQTTIWPPLCTRHMLNILSQLRPNSVWLIYYFVDRILGICQLSQTNVGRFLWKSLSLFLLLATVASEKCVIYCWGILSGPIYCCPINRLCLIMLFIRETSLLLSLHRVYCFYYLFQRAKVYLDFII